MVATFAYDALGRRIETVDAIAGTTTRYYYDDQRVAVQTQVSGGVESDFRYYVFGNYIDEVLVMAVIPAQGPIQDLYYAHDHLYSPVALLDDTGAIAERYEYDAYGQVQVLAPNYELRTTNLYGNPYYFTGRELDILDAGTLRLMYYRARTYDPETGRFMQRDPLGVNPAGGGINPFGVRKQYRDGLNLYNYVRSEPVNSLDPYGLAWGNRDFVEHYFGRGFLNGDWLMPGTSVDLSEIGLLGTFRGAKDVVAKVDEFYALVEKAVERRITQMRCGDWTGFSLKKNTVTNVTREIFSVGRSTFFRTASCIVRSVCQTPCCWSYSCTLSFGIKDRFEDPLDMGYEVVGGTVYGITASWVEGLAGGCGVFPPLPDAPQL